MSQLEEIQQFINSPAFNLLADDVQQELRNIETDLSAKEYDQQCWDLILAFKRVHRNKNKGCFAPHKPVMLLTVIDLIDKGHINSPNVNLDKELKLRFKEVWEKYVPDGCTFKCEYRNPFTHLDHEPFWHLCEDKNTAQLSDIAFESMLNPNKRTILRNSLIWMIKNETLPHTLHLYSINEDQVATVAEKIMILSPVIAPAMLSLFA